MDKKKFIEGLTGMSLKEYIQVLIADYQRDVLDKQEKNPNKN